MSLAQITSQRLRQPSQAALLPVCLVALAIALPAAWLAVPGILMTVAIYVAIATIVLQRSRTFHPFERFGAANTVTLFRAGLVALLAAIVFDTSLAARPYIAFFVAASVLLLDGLGPL